MNKFERGFNRVCNRFNLNPSDWIPHIKPDGLYEMGTSYGDGESMFDADGNMAEGTKVPIECFSIYNAFWTICYNRRERSGTEQRSRWESFWSFLSDVNLGVYDTTNWVAVGETDDTLFSLRVVPE